MPLKFSCANCEFVVTGVETYTNTVGDLISTIIRVSLSNPHTNGTALRRYVCRATERIWGSGTNTTIGAPQMDCVRGVWEHAPRKF